MKIKYFAFVLLAVCIVTTADAKDLTAFQLVKRGNEYVGVQSKDKVVQIRSEKSLGGLTPNIWYVVYYDPDATLKAVEVKFGAGEKLDVSHPLRLLEPITGDDKILDADKLKIDSDKAQAIATDHPLVKSLALKATQLQLGHGATGPEWKVKLWAAKLKHPEDMADIGVVHISATDGSILKADLHPSRLE